MGVWERTERCYLLRRCRGSLRKTIGKENIKNNGMSPIGMVSDWNGGAGKASERRGYYQNLELTGKRGT